MTSQGSLNILHIQKNKKYATAAFARGLDRTHFSVERLSHEENAPTFTMWRCNVGSVLAPCKSGLDPAADKCSFNHNLPSSEPPVPGVETREPVGDGLSLPTSPINIFKKRGERKKISSLTEGGFAGPFTITGLQN